MMIILKFLEKIVKIVYTYISTAQYALMLNGQPSELFRSTRGIRQGDLMSPLFFVTGTKYLSRIVKASSRSSKFSFHPRCRKLGLNHLIFANDLMLMSKRDSRSIQVLIESNNLFSKASGLHANCNKSAMFLAGLSNEQKVSMAEELQFPLGNLLVKYLGVLLS